jgi:hypothetical protein
MNQDFIPYEEALALKELGFDEPLSFYWEKNIIKPIPMTDEVSGFHINRHSNTKDEWIAAPLYQQAFKWVRDKYNLMGYPIWRIDNTWDFNIQKLEGYSLLSGQLIGMISGINTYEEAQLACLKKLIEIIKS